MGRRRTFRTLRKWQNTGGGPIRMRDAKRKIKNDWIDSLETCQQIWKTNLGYSALGEGYEDMCGTLRCIPASKLIQACDSRGNCLTGQGRPN